MAIIQGNSLQHAEQLERHEALDAQAAVKYLGGCAFRGIILRRLLQVAEELQRSLAESPPRAAHCQHIAETLLQVAQIFLPCLALPCMHIPKPQESPCNR